MRAANENARRATKVTLPVTVSDSAAQNMRTLASDNGLSGDGGGTPPLEAPLERFGQRFWRLFIFTTMQLPPAAPSLHDYYGLYIYN